MFISKLNASGNFVWAKRFGGIDNDAASSIAIDASDNIYTTGYFGTAADFDPDSGTFNLNTEGGDDIFVLKIRTSGVGIKEYSNKGNISVYPNPTNGQFNIVLSTRTDNASIAIYNIMGSLVFSSSALERFNCISLANQTNGVYFVRVVQNGEIIATQKIVKQ